jgi:SAM-dependent methyltransferase
MSRLDEPERGAEIERLIRKKTALYRWYLETYALYADVLSRCPKDGLAVELGAGAGFARQVLPELTTADILPYPGIDLVFDACRMPFEDQSVRCFCLLNVLHHIPDADAFFQECQRCLKVGGRLLIVDQYVGWISHWIFRYAHHEPYNPRALKWSFPSSGPLSGANGALAWIVFYRDRARFETHYPLLGIERIHTRAPLRYWLSGGLKSWSLLPASMWNLACRLDALLLRWSPRWGSFLEVEIVRRSLAQPASLPNSPGDADGEKHE